MFKPLRQTIYIIGYAVSVFFPESDLFLPAHTKDSDIHTYPGFVLQYNEKFKQADWVAYELTADESSSTIAKRSENFKIDPDIPSGTATDKDYKYSGYDRGHLAPAADMKFSQEAMKSSFYYSNISPQNPSLNRTLWASLEELVREWSITNQAVYVVTGPILNKEEYLSIGLNNVAVPEYFYKVVLDNRYPEKKGIAFIIPNIPPIYPLASYACSIDDAEMFTGIDFFYQISDSEENLLESSFNLSLWGLEQSRK